MPRNLMDIKKEAESRISGGRLVDGLKVFRLVLEGAPLDFNLRMEIADILTAANKDILAAQIYQAIADHDVKSGSPLRGLVAIKQIEAMGSEVGPLLDALVQKYAAGSPSLGRGVKLAPVDYDVPVRDDLDLDYGMEDREVVEGIAQMAAFTENITNYPNVVPPLAIFSTLQPEAFKNLLDLMRLKRHTNGDVVISQGDIGDAIYFVARGEVLVVKKISRPGEGEVEVPLARLGPGSLFGEMALISSDPRGASVVCDGAVDVLEIKNVEVNELAQTIPNVAGAMARFTRERLVSNLLATNPLFSGFDEASRKQLLARFTGHEVPSGTIFIEQGTVGTGLYVILQGNAEVLKDDDNGPVHVAELGPGDIVGEISLVHEEPATATVRTTTPATLLFLARELFYPLVEAVPDLLAHFARLAKERIEDTEFKLMKNRVLDDDFIESIEDLADIEEISDDDLILI